jgi:hypothetical protein
MSIIYEALKKVEKKNGREEKRIINYPKPALKSKIMIPLALIGIICIGFIGKGIWGNKTEVADKPKQVKAKQKALVKKAKVRRQNRGFSLQGIIYDEANSLALINGKKISIGEEIKQARLVGVARDSVELDTKKGRIRIFIDE